MTGKASKSKLPAEPTFWTLRKTKEGKPYLRITASRKGKGDKFARNIINMFPENADEFARTVSEMASNLAQS